MNPVSHQAFSKSYKTVVKKLMTDVEVIGISSLKPGQKKTVRALWDTGAECSVISPSVSDVLELVAFDSRPIAGINNISRAGMVKVTIILSNNIRISNITVMVCNLIPDVDTIIGMDIIGRGDFAISNSGNNTLFSFVTPPLETKIDLSR